MPQRTETAVLFPEEPAADLPNTTAARAAASTPAMRLPAGHRYRGGGTRFSTPITRTVTSASRASIASHPGGVGSATAG